MQSAYRAELDRLMQEDIITEVKQQPEWVNSVAQVTKPDGSIILWLDPKDLNLDPMSQGHQDGRTSIGCTLTSTTDS